MKEESLLLLSDLQKLINQVVLIDYTIIILGGSKMPFVEINVKNEIEKQRQNNPEFKKAWDESRAEYKLIGEMISLRKQENIISSQKMGSWFIKKLKNTGKNFHSQSMF